MQRARDRRAGDTPYLGLPQHPFQQWRRAAGAGAYSQNSEVRIFVESEGDQVQNVTVPGIPKTVSHGWVYLWRLGEINSRCGRRWGRTAGNLPSVGMAYRRGRRNSRRSGDVPPASCGMLACGGQGYLYVRPAFIPFNPEGDTK